MRTFTETTVTLGGYQTRLLRANNPVKHADGQRRAVLMIHGWSDSADTWKLVMDRLWDIDAELFAVDMPSFGKAGPLNPGPQLTQLDHFARAAISYFEDFDVLIPVGQSLGARAVLMGLDHVRPKNVPGACVIGPAPLELPNWQKVLIRNGQVAASASKLTDAETHEQRLAEVIAGFKRTCLAKPDTVPEWVYTEYASHIKPENAHRHIEALRAIAKEFSDKLDFQGIDCPIDIIWGTLDRMSPITGAHHYTTALPTATLVPIEECGHHAQLERPEKIADFIRARL